MKESRRKMKYLNRFIFWMTAFTAVVSAVTAKAATYNCNSCATCSTQIANAADGDTILLGNDVTELSSTCISFSSKSGLTFDCQNYELVGPYSGSIPAYFFGIQLSSSSNNTLQNCTVRNFYENIRLVSSSGNTLDNVISNAAFQNGIYLQQSSNNTISGTTANNNGNRGIYLYQSCTGNNITSCTTNYNTVGATIEYSTGNTIDGLLSDGNTYGATIAFASSNTLRNSTIENSDTAGLQFPPGFNSQYVRYNTIYNNHFSNTVNLINPDANNQPNYFNTTLNCDSVTNIISGSCVGGNFWTTPTGEGYGDTCDDINNNGICDAAYTPFSNNTDNYPLTPEEVGPPDETPPASATGLMVQ